MDSLGVQGKALVTFSRINEFHISSRCSFEIGGYCMIFCRAYEVITFSEASLTLLFNYLIHSIDLVKINVLQGFIQAYHFAPFL